MKLTTTSEQQQMLFGYLQLQVSEGASGTVFLFFVDFFSVCCGLVTSPCAPNGPPPALSAPVWLEEQGKEGEGGRRKKKREHM